ncbi:MAG: cytochrome c [Chlorobi bacterium]|nr:cytochrome c [Chlorobiota bacterium]
MGDIFVSDLPEGAKERIGGLPVAAKDTTVPQGDLPIVKGTLSPPVDVKKYLGPTQDLIDKGKILFTTNCVSCHGNEGKGDGVAGVNLNPKPRNFQDMNGWTNGPAITMMYKTLHEGITNRGMASYSNLSPEDRLDLIMFIRTLNPNFPPVTQVQLDSIDVLYSLAKGVKQPNQIPVIMAMDKILKESMPVDEKVKKIAKTVELNKTDSGAVLFKSISNNLSKALTVLALDSSWINNEKSLVSIIDNNPVQNGFKARASYMLTQKELSAIHAFLKNLFASKGI